eukprot:3623092-Lingulodinium_polyedra.AAC.1
MEPHSTGRPPTAAPTLQGNLRLGAPAFSPSGGGVAGSHLHAGTLVNGRSPARNQMIGDQLYPTIA